MTIMKYKIVMAIKKPGSSNEKKEARLVFQAIGSKDTDKHMLITSSSTVTHGSIRLMLTIGMRKKMEILQYDISQEYP